MRRLAEVGRPMVEAEEKLAAMTLDPESDLNHQEREGFTAAKAEYHRLAREVYGPGYPAGDNSSSRPPRRG